MHLRGVGAIETEQNDETPRRWIIGAAPHKQPYWKLVGEHGQLVGRVFLLFSDREEAERSMQAEFDSSDVELKRTLTRSIYALHAERATVRTVKQFTDELRQWAREVTRFGITRPMPGEIDVYADLIIFPPARFPGQLAIVDEKAIGDRVKYYRCGSLDWRG